LKGQLHQRRTDNTMTKR